MADIEIAAPTATALHDQLLAYRDGLLDQRFHLELLEDEQRGVLEATTADLAAILDQLAAIDATIDRLEDAMAKEG